MEPEQSQPRVPGLDLARSLAVLGMILVNYELVLKAKASGPAWLAGLTSLLQGRAAATFVVLAGVGVTLGARGDLASGDPVRLRLRRWKLWRRAAALLVLGLAYLPLWPADILHFYAFYLSVAALALSWSSARLWLAAAGFSLGFVVLLLTGDYALGWDFEALSYAGMWTPRGLVRRLLFNGFHPVFPWTAFLLVGMWLGRLPLQEPACLRKLFLGGALLALSTELGARLLVQAWLESPGTLDAATIRALGGTAAMPPMPQYLLAAGGSAVALIALSVALGQKVPAPWILPLVHTGQLALTLYVAHVLVGMGALEASGALGEGRSLVFSLAFSGAFFTGSVLFSTLWRRRFERGPLEALLRRLAG